MTPKILLVQSGDDVPQDIHTIGIDCRSHTFVGKLSLNHDTEGVKRMRSVVCCILRWVALKNDVRVGTLVMERDRAETVFGAAVYLLLWEKRATAAWAGELEQRAQMADYFLLRPESLRAAPTPLQVVVQIAEDYRLGLLDRIRIVATWFQHGTADQYEVLRVLRERAKRIERGMEHRPSSLVRQLARTATSSRSGPTASPRPWKTPVFSCSRPKRVCPVPGRRCSATSSEQLPPRKSLARYAGSSKTLYPSSSRQTWPSLDAPRRGPPPSWKKPGAAAWPPSWQTGPLGLELPRRAPDRTCPTPLQPFPWSA